MLVLGKGKFFGGPALDVVLGNNAARALQLYRNQGDGHFAPAGQMTTAPVLSLVGADFDGDGSAEVAALHGAPVLGTRSVAIYSASGGGLVRDTILPACDMPSEIVAGDFNNDSRPDLAAACMTASSSLAEIDIFLNTGGGAFQKTQITVPAFAPGGGLLVAEDFDGDGRQDLMFLEALPDNPSAHTGQLLLSNGDGTFRRSGAIAGLGGPLSAASVDWNDDGRPDLAVLGGSNGMVTSWLNAISSGVPREMNLVSAASLAPPLAAESIVTAFGSALSGELAVSGTAPPPTQLAGVEVSVVDSSGLLKPAELLSVSPDRVNVILPDTEPGAGLVTLSRNGAVEAQSLVQLALAAPGIFTVSGDGTGTPAGYAVRVMPGTQPRWTPVYDCGSTAGSCAPVPIDASDTVYLVLYGTGIRNCQTATARIGGVQAVVTNIQPQKLYPGMDEIEIQLPSALAGRGDVNIELQACGRAANVVRIRVQ